MAEIEVTTGQVKKIIVDFFESQMMNPNWDVIGDGLAELIPDYEPGISHQDEEDYAAELWGRARIVFDG